MTSVWPQCIPRHWGGGGLKYDLDSQPPLLAEHLLKIDPAFFEKEKLDLFSNEMRPKTVFSTPTTKNSPAKANILYAQKKK